MAWQSCSDRPRDSHPGEGAGEAEYVIAENIRQHQAILALLEECHGFEGIAGEGRKRSAETDDYEQPPARIDKDAFGGPDHEKADNETAYNVDDQRAVGKDGAELAHGKAAENVSEIGSQNGSNGYSGEVFQA